MSDPSTPQVQKTGAKAIIIVLVLLSVIIFCLGIGELMKANEIYNTYVNPSETFQKNTVRSLTNMAAVKDAYTQALSYFSMALGALAIAAVLPRISSLNWTPGGAVSVTLNQLQKDVAALKQSAVTQEKMMTKMQQVKDNKPA